MHVVRGIAESEQALIHVGEPGLWFGEHGMLSGRPALAGVVATTNARTLLLPIAGFQRIVAEEPRYYPQFAALLFERFATVFRYASEARSVPAEDWLWTRLQDLAAIRRLDAQIQGPIDINVSQSELATMVGVSRQTLCMLLGRLQERGQIDVGYKRIRVLKSAATAASGGSALLRRLLGLLVGPLDLFEQRRACCFRLLDRRGLAGREHRGLARPWSMACRSRRARSRATAAWSPSKMGRAWCPPRCPTGTSSFPPRWSCS